MVSLYIYIYTCNQCIYVYLWKITIIVHIMPIDIQDVEPDLPWSQDWCLQVIHSVIMGIPVKIPCFSSTCSNQLGTADFGAWSSFSTSWWCHLVVSSSGFSHDVLHFPGSTLALNIQWLAGGAPTDGRSHQQVLRSQMWWSSLLECYRRLWWMVFGVMYWRMYWLFFLNQRFELQIANSLRLCQYQKWIDMDRNDWIDFAQSPVADYISGFITSSSIIGHADASWCTLPLDANGVDQRRPIDQKQLKFLLGKRLNNLIVIVIV